MIDFDSELRKALASYVHYRDFQEVLDYALRPPGKLFRPRLLEAIASDLKLSNTSEVATLGCALELHHAYTLVHDDMPCMDNDQMRRGKPATHAAHGEWKALLTGDALLLISLSHLEKLRHPQAAQIRQLFHWAAGPKGLLLGQWLDLACVAKDNPQRLVRIHQLKTARLMQVATLGGYYLSQSKPQLAGVKHYLRLGSAIGIAFQLLDDLSDLMAGQIGEHEIAANPFLTAPKLASNELKLHLDFLTRLPQANTKLFINTFLRASTSKLLQNESSWMHHFKQDAQTALRDILTIDTFV